MRDRTLINRIFFAYGALASMVGLWGFAEGIRSWHVHHGAAYVMIGGLLFLVAGVTVCAATWRSIRVRR